MTGAAALLLGGSNTASKHVRRRRRSDALGQELKRLAPRHCYEVTHLDWLRGGRREDGDGQDPGSHQGP
jgi:hypothetical protein